MNIPDSIKNNKYIILFDGVCNLCSGFMHFVFKRDQKSIFKFAWLQDNKSKEILSWLSLPRDKSDTIILIEAGQPYFKSQAVIKILRLLRFPWPLFIMGYIFPTFFRDWIYDFVAENRYKWFGKKEQCIVPTEEAVKRFL
jgi:predicted DCC family thiol-disulfide oxidoreductase YuxK